MLVPWRVYALESSLLLSCILNHVALYMIRLEERLVLRFDLNALYSNGQCPFDGISN